MVHADTAKQVLSLGTQVIAQFPEFAKLIHSSMSEYKNILEKIVASGDESTNQIFAIVNKEIDTADESMKEFIGFADKVRSDLSKCLDNPNLSPEQQKEIRDQEMEVLRIVDKKNTEIQEQKTDAARMADKKDLEKKEFDLKIIGAASFVVLTIVEIGATALGRSVNIKLPKPII